MNVLHPLGVYALDLNVKHDENLGVSSITMVSLGKSSVYITTTPVVT
jgi:hypothetical protein